MLFLNPRSVLFGPRRWDGVETISVERAATRLVVDRPDGGSYPVFVDVAEQSVAIRVVQRLAGHDTDPPRCGEEATLSFLTGPTDSQARPGRVAAVAVVRRVAYEFSRSRGISRVVTLAAVSPDGHSDPVSVIEDSSGA
ncbi:MAG: hypothetical protein KF787_04660 [Phycisphaeraceae bacterium]|nr:hypothetical protein [Phycisphaerae bacterium]MBX3391920.1 hypothetical protein [Phycisphaeraceae bacterium]